MSDAIVRAANIVGGQSRLATLLGVAPPTVNQWIKGLRPVPITFCVAIERVTEGVVTRRELRSDDWRLIWPELAELAEV
ncbi:MAG: Cro/CI family transcriptional regulator [Proteobacteria bacterium]|nr:Cro/CI family transcriptional regulator [Pseudomonadota bacterium]